MIQIFPAYLYFSCYNISLGELCDSWNIGKTFCILRHEKNHKQTKIFWYNGWIVCFFRVQSLRSFRPRMLNVLIRLDIWYQWNLDYRIVMCLARTDTDFEVYDLHARDSRILKGVLSTSAAWKSNWGAGGVKLNGPTTDDRVTIFMRERREDRSEYDFIERALKMRKMTVLWLTYLCWIKATVLKASYMHV